MKSDFVVKLKLKGAKQLIEAFGLGERGRIQAQLTNEIYKHSDKYTPFDNGDLKRNTVVTADKIHYFSPYARFLWYGKLMVGEKTGRVWAKKHEGKVLARPTRYLKYNGAPRRGRMWVVRMWNDRGQEILKGLANNGGKGK